MSKNNETTILLLALLITGGLIGTGAWLFFPRGGLSPSITKTDSPQPAINDRISFGEKFLTTDSVSTEKTSAAAAIKANNYQSAIAKLETSLKSQPNDPEALIYLNNAKIGNAKSYTIGAAISDPEILRGIAQAQLDINATGGINGTPLKVAIANDSNKIEVAQQIAAAFVQNPEILGVVGPYTSDATIAASKIYDDGKLVAIAPISTSVEVPKLNRQYIFRTVPSDFVAAGILADYTLKTLQKKNVAVFYSSQSNYSESLKSEFIRAVTNGGGQVTNEIDLSKSDFSAAQSLRKASEQKAESLALLPDHTTLDLALQIVQVNQGKLPLLAGDDVYALKTLEVVGKQAEGMVVAIPWHINSSNTPPEFRDRSRQLWKGDVSWRTATAYDATRALIAALQKNPTRTGIQQILAASDFSTTGASGTIRFFPSRDRNAPSQLVKVVPSVNSPSKFEFYPLK